MANPKLFGTAVDQEFARTLRAIGNDLAPSTPENLEIEVVGATYRVVYHVRRQASVDAAQTRALLAPQTQVYDAAAIAALDSLQITKRGTAANTPDIYDLSETLRTAGRLIDRIEGELIRLTKNTHSLLLQYRDSKGNAHTDEFSSQDLFRLQREFFAARETPRTSPTADKL